MAKYLDANGVQTLSNNFVQNSVLTGVIQGIDKTYTSIGRLSSETGQISFNDAEGDLNLKDLEIAFTPIQSGSGDPSPTNVRPISGVSSVAVTRHNAPPDTITITMTQSGSGDPSPTNVRPITPGLSFTRDDNSTLDVYGGALNVTTGTLTVTHKLWTLGNIPVSEDGWRKYDGKFFFDFAERALAYGNSYDAKSNVFQFGSVAAGGSDSMEDYHFYPLRASSAASKRVYFYVNDLAGSSPASFRQRCEDNNAVLTLPLETPVTYNLSVTELSRALAALGYSAQSVTVSLVDGNNDPLTVYGGTLDVTSGELAVQWRKVTLASVGSTWYDSQSGATAVGFFSFLGHWVSNDNPRVLCDRLPIAPGNGNVYGNIYTESAGAINNYVAFRLSRERLGNPASATDALAAANAWLAENPLTICYKLGTPLTYQLTAQQLAALSGYNNIIINNGVISNLEYFKQNTDLTETYKLLKENIPTAATATPLMDGAAAVGTSATYARADHVHPVDTSRASAADMSTIKALLQNAIFYRTTSGNLATFQDGYPENFQKLSVTLTPTQRGSGDPSPDNIRNISGVSSVTVTRTGKNLYSKAIGADGWNGNSSGVATNDNGVLAIHFQNPASVVSGVYSYVNGLITTIKKVNGPVTVSFTCVSEKNAQVRFGDATTFSSNLVSLSAGVPLRVSHTYPNGSQARCLIFYQYGNSDVNTIRLSDAMIETGETATAYEACQGQTVTVPLVGSNNAALTVYGGTLDVTAGTLTVTWANIASYNGETLPGRWMSDRDVYASGATPTTGAQVVYELAAPVTYTLTAAQLATLAGYNSVSADAGSVAVEYRADVALALGG